MVSSFPLITVQNDNITFITINDLCFKLPTIDKFDWLAIGFGNFIWIDVDLKLSSKLLQWMLNAFKTNKFSIVSNKRKKRIVSL